MTKYLSITSGENVVGKTITSINLAAALAIQGRKTVLLDLNLNKPDISSYLGFNNHRPTLQDVINGKSTIKEATFIHQSGLKILPTTSSREDQHHFYEGFHKLILNLFGKAEFVVIDTGSLPNEHHQSLFSSDDDLLIVANPNVHSIRETLRTLRIIEKTDANVLGIVLYNIQKQKSDLDHKVIERTLNKPLLSIIPMDANINKSTSLKHPLVYSHPKSPAANEFTKLADFFID